MKKKKTRFIHYVEYIFTWLLIAIVRILPVVSLYYFARIISVCLTVFINFRNKIILENLKIAFPEANEKDLFKIRDEMYTNILMTSIESLKYGYLSAEKKKELIDFDKDSFELLKKHEDGNGCMVVGGHLGFFEGAGFVPAAYGFKSSFVVANQKNKLTEKLIDIPRENNGIKVVHRSRSIARELIMLLRKKYFIAMLSDQDAGKHGVFVDFFGKKASTHKGVAVFALKFKTPVLFVDIRRDKKKKYKHVLKFIEIDYTDILNSDDKMEEKELLLVQRYTKVLEDYIRIHPEEYWWIHKRYKTKPKN
ncbi:MAG: lysophospholipid acyltransferase family protein [Candidatus Delongbacteria bacterium]|nr:lysophospholipid acyltransferase family protein [Candidatus Delongbacteria bacterium]MBN2835588.1 lysophospholipid acyltransferase family protein [Candidatus Delongbacteria bacterium]